MMGAMAAGVLVAGLTGCGDDAEAGTAEESGAAEGTDAPIGEENDDAGGAGAAGEAEEPEPVPASSEGPAENWPEPEVPEEASEQTEEGVEAALQYWFKTRQYARNTGDTAPLEAASTENCAFCLDQAEQVEGAFEQGWYVQELDEVAQTAVTFDEGDVAQVAFLMTQASYEAYVDGELLGESEAQEDMSWSGALIYSNGRWVIADLVFVSEGADGNQEVNG